MSTTTGRNQTFSTLQGFKTFCVPFILQFLGKVGMVGELVGGGGGGGGGGGKINKMDNN